MVARSNRSSRRAASSSRSSRGRRRSNVVTVDMKGVEGRIKVLDGEYLAHVAEVTREEGPAGDYLKWKIQINEGEDCAGGILYNNTSLAKQALWNLRSWLEALDVEVPDSELDIDLDDMVDRELMVGVENETFEGKKQPRLVDFWRAEEETAPKTSGKREREPERPTRDGGLSSDRRSGGRSEREERPTERTSSRSSTKTSRSKEPEEPPPLTQDEINDMSQEELEDLVKEEKLDVDVAKLKTLRRMRAAVIDAAEKDGILAD